MSVEKEICRVCRSEESQEMGPLFYPCKCSDQQCLEEWLLHSSKKTCQICNHTFNFKPIYSQNTPSKLSILNTIMIILNRILKAITFYLRVFIVVFSWLIWTPFVTCKIWRLFLQTPQIKAQHKPDSLLYDYLVLLDLDEKILDLVQRFESSIDWKSYLKEFFSDVFEGQIICSVVIVIGLLMLLLREYVIARVEDQPMPNADLGRREIEERGEGLARRRDQLLADNLDLDIRQDRIEQEQLPEHVQAREGQTQRQNTEEEAVARSLERINAPRLRARMEQAPIDAYDLVDHAGQANAFEVDIALPGSPNGIDVDQHFEFLTEGAKANVVIDPELNVPRRGSLNILNRRSSIEAFSQFGDIHNRMNSIGASTGSGDILHHKSSIVSSLGSGDMLNRRGSIKGHVSSGASELPPVSTHGYNLRSKRSVELKPQNVSPQDNEKEATSKGKGRLEEIEIEKAGAQLQSDQASKKRKRPLTEEAKEKGEEINVQLLSQSKRDVKGKGKMVDNAVLNTEDESYEWENIHSPESESQHSLSSADHTFHRQIDNFDEIRRNQNQLPIARPPAVPQPQQQPPIQQVPPNAQQPVNINLNVGIGDGELVAQIEVNDFQAFLDLVGITGPILRLLQSIIIVHLVSILVLGIGIWIPFTLGKSCNIAMNDIVTPYLSTTLQKSIDWVEKMLDPITEPIANAILTVVTDTNIKNITSNVKKDKSAPFLDTVWKVLGVLSSNDESLIEYGPYNPNFFQTLHQSMTQVLLGYVLILILFLLYAKFANLQRNPYVIIIGRLFNSMNDNIVTSVKVLTFITFEMIGFPFYCGLLIDLFTLQIFSSTIANRLLTQQNHPWMFFFIHWTIGSTFMFQFAMYVGVIRENLRPGVLWFIKDPNDPNFNAMHEIFHRPLFSQLRKLFLAIFFYGVVILGVFGGSVSLVSCFDFIVSKMGKDLLKVFPLRLEYHDTIGDIPFDLFFFQFIIPVFYRVIDPKTKFKAVVREWFYFVSKKLSLSHFLLGKAQVDEESDDEDENQRDWRGLQNGASRSDQSDEEWEDISNRREKRYLRVPNRDMIDFKPGETLLVWMKESDPVFGRPNESPQDIQRNWTKVYVPTNFYPRLVFVLFLQWFSFAFGISGLLAVPLIVGRIVFVKLNQLVTRGPVIPDGFNNPVKAFREDLPTHDVYSYLLGVFVTYTFSMIIYKVYKYITRSKLVRKNAIRRSQTSRQSESFRDSWSKYYHRRGRSTLQKLFKLSYLVSIIVFIIPILLGLLFNLMIISPIDAILNRTPIVFILIDWSTGAMALRVIYNVILMNPESRICRLITDAQNQHISQLNLWELNRKIFIPLISTCFGLLSLPFLGHVYELVFGTFCFNIEIDGVCLMVKRFSLVFLGGFYVGIKASRYAGQRLHEWFEHLKDDQYLIGRTLENVGE